MSDNVLEITELSADKLTRRTVTRGDGWPAGFILVGPRTTDEPPPATTASPDSTLI